MKHSDSADVLGWGRLYPSFYYSVIRFQIFRVSRGTWLVNSRHVTQTQILGMSPIRVIFSLQDSYDLLLTIISTKNLNNCVQMFHDKSLMRCKEKMHDRYTVTQCWLMFKMRKIHNFRRYMWSREFSLLNLNQKLKFLVFKNINAANKRCKQLIFLILPKTRRKSDE